MMIKRLFLALLIASAGALSAVGLAACDDEDGEVLPDDAQEVDVEMTDTAIEPDRVEVTPGTIRFRIENNGDQPHELAVETANEVETSGEVDPGETGSMSVPLPPGEYAMYDPQDDFRERGVEGVVVVRDTSTDTVERTVTDEDTDTVTREDTDTVTDEDTDTVTREDTDTVTRQETVTRERTVPQQDQQTTTTP